ncbi:MAG: serine/threonine protein kinase [Planctomycetes bacterium]|nr:serine/threonine protein kinase [Planctomycetota bacterium]
MSGEPADAGDRGTRDDRVAARVHDYLLALEQGTTTDAETFVADLDEPERALFRSAIALLGDEILPALPRRERPGAVIGDRYELRDELGAGGFGRIWRARDLRLGRDVAVKFLAVRPQERARFEAMFLAERDAMARVDAAGVARILDAQRAGDDLVLVMDLVAGRSLHAVLAALREVTEPWTRPRMTDLAAIVGTEVRPGDENLLTRARYEDFAVDVVRLLLRALEGVHAAGIVHRDIKPANVMLRAGGRPVLLDFGMATTGDGAAGLSGTPQYLAPEQIRGGRSGDDPRTDVYQTGLVLYELLALRPAYAATTVDEVLAKVVNGDCEPLGTTAPWVDAELATIAERALAPDPEARFATASAFRDALDRWFRATHLPEWDPDRFETIRRELDDPRLARLRMHDRQRGIDVCVELPGPALAARLREEFDKVLREVRALEQVDHPGVLRLRGAYVDADGLPRLVLDARGVESLADRLARDGPLARDAVVQLGIELADALAAVHATGHLHRDVATRNVLLDEHGHAMLAGFCFARPLDPSGGLSSLDHAGCDTPGANPQPVPDHSAPEQLRGMRADHRADIFALGCVLHRAATGRDVPSDGRTAPDLAALRRRTGRRVAAVIERCLARERTGRHPHMRAVADALRAAVRTPRWQFWRQA